MPDLFGAIKDVGNAVVGAAGDALDAVTPAALKDRLFGSVQAPPAPTTPAAAQGLVDTVVGHQPDDDQILKNIQALGQTSSSVSVLDTMLDPGLKGMPYDPHTTAQIATGTNIQPPDPLTLANPHLQKYFKDVPRAQEVYIKNYLATDPSVISWAVAQNTKAVPGLLSQAVSKFTDLAGRPIGGTLDMLAKPAAWVETWYGNHLLFNDVGDSSVRQVLARHAYEYSGAWGSDPGSAHLRAARLESIHIEQDLGLRGPAAAAEMEKWYKTDGNPGLMAHVVDGLTQMTLDPLWLIPTGAIGASARVGMKGAAGTEDVSKLFRLANAPGLLGDFTLREILTMPELDYRSATLTHAASLGPGRWVNERLPARLGDASYDLVQRYLSGPVQRSIVLDPATGAVDGGKTIDAMLTATAHFSDSIRSGKMSDKAAALFGTEMLDNPVAAALALHTTSTIPKLAATSKGMYITDVAQGVMEGLDKTPELAQLAASHPQAFGKLLTDFVAGNARTIAADGQYAVFPRWFRKLLRVNAMQKQVLSFASIDRPSLAPAVVGSNTLAYFSTISGSVDPAKIYAETYGAVLRAGDQALPENTARVFGALGMEPSAAWRVAASQTYAREAVGASSREIDQARRFENIDNVEEAGKKALHDMTRPIQDMQPSGLMNKVKWPLTIASRNDMAIRGSAFTGAAQEQLNLIMSPAHLLEGLFPDMRATLVDTGMPLADAQRLEGVAVDRMRAWVGEGNSLADSDAVVKQWHSIISDMREGGDPAQVSAYDYLHQYLAKQGVPEAAIPFAAKDFDPAMRRIATEIFPKIGKVPMEQTQAQFEALKLEYYKMDQAIAHMSGGDPILRPVTSYSQGLAAAYGHDITQMEEVWKGDMADKTAHVDRYLNTVRPTWEGADETRRAVVAAADEHMYGSIKRLSQIATESIGQLADPARVWDRDTAWKEYWHFTRESERKFYDEARAAAAAVNADSAGPIDAWYAAETAARDRHMAITARAMRQNTPAGWDAAAQQVADTFKKMANDRAAILGVSVNDPVKMIGSPRATAPGTRQIEEYITHIQDNLGPDLAKAREAAAAKGTEAGAPVLKNPYDSLEELGNEIAKRAPTMAQRAIGNAMFKTDLVRMNYDKQYGWDGILQSFMPYEVFATRTAMNWLLRTVNQPGYTAMLAKSILLPQQYAEDYGHHVAPGAIPIPLPGVANFLSRLPGIGDKIKAGKFGSIYWVDPMEMLFPMTRFTNNYNNEAKSATPAGQFASWMESNTPLGLSPFAKLIGGATGILPRDAWTNSLFSGGPFGMPVSMMGKIATNWLHTGDTTGMPPQEMANYTNHGVFSWQFLGSVMGLTDKTSLEQSKIQKALAANVADGTTTIEDALQALKTQNGPSWRQAKKTTDSAKFLQDFTGWLGFRMTGSSVGDNILLGQRALYSKAAANGDLTEFYKAYPGYSVSQIAAKGVTDPVAAQQMIDTQLYFSDIQRLVKDPYQKSLDDLNMRMNNIRGREVITQTDNQQLLLYEQEIGSIKKQQNQIYAMVDRAYPTAKKDPSLFTMPNERALMGAASRWYAIRQGEGNGIDPQETYQAFKARQQAWLGQFPPHTSQTDEAWQSLGQDFLIATMQYNTSINIAAQGGDWAKVTSLVNDRNDALTQIHAAAVKTLSRQDMEQYLSSVTRTKSPAEREFDYAKALFQYWMAAVAKTNTMYTPAQKSSISAYFRADPMLQKHYNASTIDLRALTPEQRLAVDRRDTLLKQYNALYPPAGTTDAQIDFMKQHEHEINYANQILGFPPMDITDFRPPPPDIAALDPYLASREFAGHKNLADYLYGGATPPGRGTVQQATANSPDGSAPPAADMQSIADASAGRGY